MGVFAGLAGVVGVLGMPGVPVRAARPAGCIGLCLCSGVVSGVGWGLRIVRAARVPVLQRSLFRLVDRQVVFPV